MTGVRRGKTRLSAYLNWGLPSLVILSAVAAGLVYFVFPDSVLRKAVIMWFLFACPGLALVRFFRIGDPIIEWTLVLTLSICVDAGVAGILLYSGHWSPPIILVLLIGFCLACALSRLVAMLIHFVIARLRQARLSKAQA
jgi:hypothetical protein